MHAIDKIEPVEALEASTRHDIATFNTAFQSFCRTLNEFSACASPTLAEAIDFNIIKMGDVNASSGVPGTFQTGIEDISAQVTEAFGALSAFSSTVTAGIEEATRPALEGDHAARVAMEDAKKNAGIVEEIVGEMIPALAKKSEKVQKKADKASEKKSAKSLRKLMEKVVAARAEHAASRAQMLDRGCASFSDFQSSVSVVRDACCGRVTAMKRGFDLVKDEYSRLAQRLRNCGASLKEKAEKIDFRSDFEKFVAETKIIRYDLECLPFESVDTSHPAFAGIETRINVAVPPLYPLALAKVVHSFAPENANEIACTKGKYVLLMEKADEEWVFVQNPVTNAMGYAPSACFEEVGDTIGVFIEQPDAETVRDARVSLGDYVAVIGNAKDDKLVVVTTRGLTTSVDSKVIGIITS